MSKSKATIHTHALEAVIVALIELISREGLYVVTRGKKFDLTPENFVRAGVRAGAHRYITDAIPDRRRKNPSVSTQTD